MPYVTSKTANGARLITKVPNSKKAQKQADEMRKTAPPEVINASKSSDAIQRLAVEAAVSAEKQRTQDIVDAAVKVAVEAALAAVANPEKPAEKKEAEVKKTPTSSDTKKK